MAARFWVTGGTGNWNSTTNWSATTGGASGASVPSTSDTAAFDASSGSGTATLDISPTVQTLTMTGFTGTLAFGTNTISLNSTGTIFTGATTMAVTGTPLIICTNSSATTRTITPTAVTEANSISFRVTAGTGSVVFTTAQSVRDLDFTDGVNPTGFAGALGNSANTIYGNLKASTGMTVTAGTGTWTFAATSGTKTINTAGVTFDKPFTFNGVGGTWQLQAALTSGATRTTTLTNGTLDLNGYTLTTGLFTTNTTNTTTLAFGTGNITASGVGTVFTGSATCTVTGTPQVILTDNSATARTITPGAVTEANSISFRVTAGTGTFTISNNQSVRNLDFTDGTNPTGFGGSVPSVNTTVYGNFKASTGMSFTGGTGTYTFAATSGTKTITSAGLTIDRPFTFNGVGGSWQLQDALTSGATRGLTLTSGTLDLVSYTLTTGIFSSTASTARTLAMGTGKIVITGNNATVCTTNTATNLTVTGSKRVEFSYSGSVGTRAISGTTTATGIEGTNLLDYFVTAGSDIVTFTSSRVYGTIDFYNAGASTFTGTFTNSTLSVYGDLAVKSGMTVGSGALVTSFLATSGTKTITSNGQGLDFPITINGAGGTFQLADALNLVTNSRTFLLTAGTFNTNGYAFSVASVSSSNTNTRALNLGASAVTLTSAGTPWNLTDPTNMTFNAGTSTITLTNTTNDITFSGGGKTYYNIISANTAYNFLLTSVPVINNLTVSNTTVAGTKPTRIDTNTTINTLTLTGANGNCRVLFYTSPTGTQITATASTVSLVDVDFRDIAAAGASIPWTGTRLGNVGNNANITFAAGKTVYWNKAAGGSWGDTAWATSSGGATSTLNQPLGQDTAIFDNTGLTAGSTVILGNYLFGALDCSSLTNALIFQTDSTYTGPSIGKNVTLSSAVSFTGTVNVALSGRLGTQSITSAGVNWACGISIQPLSTLLLVDNLSTDDVSFTLGPVDLNGKTLTCNTFSGTGTSTRSIAFNSGSIEVAGSNATVWNAADLTNFSYTGTPTVNFTYSGSTGTRAVQNGNTTGATETNVIDLNIVAGSDLISFSGSGYFRNLTFQPAYTGNSGLPTGAIYGNLLLSPSQTVQAAASPTTFAATSGTKTITTNGVVIDRPLTFNGVGGTWSLQDALTLGATNGTMAITGGTFNTNNYNVTASTFGGTGTSVRAINLGSSTITVTGNFSTTVGFFTITNLTFNAGTSTFDLTGTGVSAKGFQGGGLTFYRVKISGNSPTVFSSGNTRFYELSNTVTPLTVTFGNLSTPMYFDNFLLSGTAGNLLTLSSTVPGSQFLMAKNTGGKVLVSYVSITDSNVTPAGYWFAPTSQGNVDGGNNTGWNFASAGGAGGFLPFF